MYPAQQKLDTLIGALGFEFAEANKVFGELQGTPVSMTVLDVQPLSLFFAFRAAPPPDLVFDQPPAWLPTTRFSPSSVTFENGIVWLSLDDLTVPTVDEIVQELSDFAATLVDNGASVARGCLRCGETEGAQTMYVGGRAARLCQDCLYQATHEQVSQEESLNRSSATGTFILPLMIAIAALGWALFWVIIDLGLVHWQVKAIELNQWSMLVILAVFGGIGLLLGWPLGKAFRGAAGHVLRSYWWSIGLTTAAVLVGEFLYVMYCLFQAMGIVDPLATMALFVPFLLGYGGFWTTIKLLTAAALGFSCHRSSQVRAAAMNV